MIGKSMARGDDESTPSARAEAEGRSVGTRGWFIISECHWLTIIGELRSLWFAIIYCFRNPKCAKIFFVNSNIFGQKSSRLRKNWQLSKSKGQKTVELTHQARVSSVEKAKSKIVRGTPAQSHGSGWKIQGCCLFVGHTGLHLKLVPGRRTHFLHFQD